MGPKRQKWEEAAPARANCIRSGQDGSPFISFLFAAGLRGRTTQRNATRRNATQGNTKGAKAVAEGNQKLDTTTFRTDGAMQSRPGQRVSLNFTGAR